MHKPKKITHEAPKKSDTKVLDCLYNQRDSQVQLKRESGLERKQSKGKRLKHKPKGRGREAFDPKQGMQGGACSSSRFVEGVRLLKTIYHIPIRSISKVTTWHASLAHCHASSVYAPWQSRDQMAAGSFGSSPASNGFWPYATWLIYAVRVRSVGS